MKSTKKNPRQRKLNVRLLRCVKHHILEEPLRLDMGNWKADRTEGDDAPPCGTVACIAGWALILSEKPIPEFLNIARDAAKLLGVRHTQSSDSNCDDDCQAGKLFLRLEWPEPFQQQYRFAKTPAERAKIAAARIEHLITTGE